MVDIKWLTREDIGLTQPNRWNPYRSYTTGIFFHHSGTAKASKPRSVEQSIQQWRNIQLDHLIRISYDQDGHIKRNPDGTTRYWNDIAYNIGIGYRCVLDGQTLSISAGGTGWPWDTYTISICVLGNMTIEDLDEDQEQSILFALRRIRQVFGSNLTINGDRDVNWTNCPGDNLYANMGRLWRESAIIAPTPQPVPQPEPEDEDMGKPLHIVRSPDDYEAQFVRWDNSELTHHGPNEIRATVFQGLPVIVETDRPSYHRLVTESGTTWRPLDWP